MLSAEKLRPLEGWNLLNVSAIVYKVYNAKLRGKAYILTREL